MFAFFNLGLQEIVILLLFVGLVFVAPVVAVVAAVSLLRRSERAGAERLRAEVERLKQGPA
jgi:uncharacterized membrane protein HdeD (DUF308 family)